MLITVTEKQFFKMFPPETRNIYLNDEIIASLGREVICDICNAQIFLESDELAYLVSYNRIPLKVGDISSVICECCAKKHK